MAKQKQYIAIDLKSFYASVECVERGLDPLDANLVVADESRTDKTICLAVSPALKALGIPGRARLFEVKQRLREVNRERQRNAPGGQLRGKSAFASELSRDPALEAELIVARPRMRFYMEYSRNIVSIYLRSVSAEDMLVYSVDEVFIDATPYLRTCGMTAREFAMTLIREVLQQTHITGSQRMPCGTHGGDVIEQITLRFSLRSEIGSDLSWLHHHFTQQHHARTDDLAGQLHHADQGVDLGEISAIGSDLLPDIRDRIQADHIHAPVGQI